MFVRSSNAAYSSLDGGSPWVVHLLLTLRTPGAWWHRGRSAGADIGELLSCTLFRFLERAPKNSSRCDVIVVVVVCFPLLRRSRKRPSKPKCNPKNG